MFLGIFAHLAFSVLIGVYLGNPRRIGFIYSFIFCITLSPVIGLIITLISPSLQTRQAYKDIKDKYLVWAIFSFIFAAIVGVAGIYNLFLYFDDPYFYKSDSIIPLISLSVGLVSLGLYIRNPPERLMPINVELQPEKTVVLIPKKEKVVTKRRDLKIAFKWKFNLPYRLIGVIVFVLLFIGWLLKPGYGRFKEFADDIHGKKQKISCRKTGDYLIYALYEKVVYNEYATRTEIVSKEKYVGYLLNFHKIR